jgi:hypothetical protein
VVLSLEAQLRRCDAEIAQATELLLAEHLEIEGLCLAVADWSENKRLIEGEILECRTETRARCSGCPATYAPTWAGTTCSVCDGDILLGAMGE